MQGCSSAAKRIGVLSPMPQINAQGATRSAVGGALGLNGGSVRHRWSEPSESLQKPGAQSDRAPLQVAELMDQMWPAAHGTVEDNSGQANTAMQPG